MAQNSYSIPGAPAAAITAGSVTRQWMVPSAFAINENIGAAQVTVTGTATTAQGGQIVRASYLLVSGTETSAQGQTVNASGSSFSLIRRRSIIVVG